MNRKEFKKITKELIDKKSGIFDKNKIDILDNLTKNNLISYIVRNRYPIITCLLNKETDIIWLNCMGYFYYTQGKYFEFLHTCEHKIKL
jgi:hypothetical protein